MLDPSSVPPTATPANDELIIEAGRSEAHYWKDLWRFRELLGFLAWRDIKVRYKQTVLGVAWAVMQPLITTVIFTFIFGRLAQMPSGGLPYPLIVLAGMLPWQLFSAAFSGAGGSLVSNAHLVSKVYFPRLVIPLSSIGVALIDFLVVLALYTGVSLYFGHPPGLRIVFLPILILAALLIAFSAGLWLSALTVRYRDFRYIMPFMLQIGLFISPIGFRTDNYPNWHFLLSLNPMTAVIDGFRWCLLDTGGDFYWPGATTSFAITGTLLVSGVLYFRRTERRFADII